jgi:hypothetical protein
MLASQDDPPQGVPTNSAAGGQITWRQCNSCHEKMQEAFEKDQAIFTSDEHQGYVNVHIGKCRDRLRALPELQALASAHADLPSLVIATNGADVSPASASLPQGGTAAPVYCSAARHGGLIAANTVVTGGPKSTASGVFAYIDNLFTRHHDPMTAFHGFRKYEESTSGRKGVSSVRRILSHCCH